MKEMINKDCISFLYVLYINFDFIEKNKAIYFCSYYLNSDIEIKASEYLKQE